MDKDNSKKSAEISPTSKNMVGLYLSKEFTFLITKKLPSSRRLNSEERTS